MDKEHERILLTIARGAVGAAVKGQRPQEATSDEQELLSACGCFVTLKNKGRLRGCIGQFISDKPLIELVSEMAVASATKDPRFGADPITLAELDSLDVEISVLSPLKKTEDPLSLRLGIDGIYITCGAMSGCFLPQVATETGWNEREFLTNCCVHKAGLSANAWEKGDTEVYLFTADVFGAPFADV
ncbi:MAG: AMMECR1 domain-containing protein [Planctomycetota bacterium]|nr:MAG: AMMECR1 domain-containing protein [Planctomycetota bacterium]